VRRVVYASGDANPDTAGIGPARLTSVGIEVRRGSRDIERRALQQNAGFHSVHLRGRPYVTAKWAMTPNGRFATGDRNRPWISGEESRAFVHYLRAGSGAIAVGIGTVLADDPLLTVRGPIADRIFTPPLRVVYDRALRLSLDSQLVRTSGEAPVLCCCLHDAPPLRELALRDAGVDVWRAPFPEPGASCPPAASLAMLAKRGVNDVLLECGPTMLKIFHDADLIDGIVAFVGSRDAPVDQPGLEFEHPLVRDALDTPGIPSGDDQRHVTLRHPIWELAGAIPD